VDGLCSSLGRGSASAPLSLGASRHSRKPLREAGPNLLPVVHVRNDLDSAPGRADCADDTSHQDARHRGRVTAGQPPRTSKLAPVGFGEKCVPQTQADDYGCLPEPAKSAARRYAMGFAHSSLNPSDEGRPCIQRATSNGNEWSPPDAGARERPAERRTDHRQRPRSQGILVRSYVEPVSGFEPLTVRLQGGCSAN
jgi:hypothetical protein